MSDKIAKLFARIQEDPWRKEVGFSEEMEETHRQLAIANDEENIISHIGNWLQKYQPCLFGRIAARLNLLSFCIITEEDLQGSDEKIQAKIQTARSKWTEQGFEGTKSGFILCILSKKLSYALPNEALLLLAKQICTYYLLEDIEQNQIYTDEIWLENPGREQATWKWIAGVNYFCANADKRWWQDHRFPGGMAFSVNSVGHMAKASGISKIMIELNKVVGLPPDNYVASKVDSLDEALEFAMRTIALASNAVSGKATELLDDEKDAEHQTCPIKLPKQLEGKNCRQYRGYYHTDETIPSEYFLPDIERPENCGVHSLDFTYLFDSSISNPDFIKMGSGRQVRATTEKQELITNPKVLKSYPQDEEITQGSRLYEVLKSK